jgi:glycosyltransferase involved in cell wall biosynthesis
MRLGAPYFAARLAGVEPQQYLGILCSDFVDAAALRGLLPSGMRALPIFVYFHENQFAYPVQKDDVRDLHFGLTNFTTGLAADRLAFNSRYNLETFLTGAKEVLAHCSDFQLGTATLEEMRRKSSILPPGVEVADIDAEPGVPNDGPPVIVWSHRWEHDKNPEPFFAALDELAARGVDFRVLVLGKANRCQPPVFAAAREKLGRRIMRFGHVDNRLEYVRLLRQGDVVVSTSRHEFFGISVMEAVRAGCRPLLPRRLSYPELFRDEFLYDDDRALADALRLTLEKGRLDKEEAQALTNRFSWPVMAAPFSEWLAAMAGGIAPLPIPN